MALNLKLLAILHVFRVDLREESGSDVLISGMAARNRAVHGDFVVVEILPRSQWQGRSTAILEPGAGRLPNSRV